ncbi:MAG: TonB-dependent receptor [Steroidobacteraceae bacterium]|jgi:iron complex outermembrane receptor protein|nr:TonB-dependent receptor [Steroidobacteraceae bacterium]
MTTRNSRLTLLAASIAAALGTAPALAAPAQGAQASNELEEIVVTARQREEKLVDVPVTVQAFTATEIAAAGIERPQDFIALTPGVSQVQTAEVGDIQVNIRGINTGRDTETNFALVIDGVLQTNPAALNQELAGVTQIEILKGPQGALYGRNAVAGAMIISTRKPTDAFEAEATVGAGSDGLIKGNFFLGGPLGAAKVGLTGFYRDYDGQWNNRRLGCDDCVDRLEEYGAQLRTLFDVGGGAFDFKARFSKVDAGAINFNAVTSLVEAAGWLRQFGVPTADSFNSDPNQHKFDYVNNIAPQNEQENINLSLKGDWDVGIGTLTAYLAFNDQENFFLTDGTSAAFGLYATNPVCQASIASNAAGFPLQPPFNYGTPPARADIFLPPYSNTTCDGYQYQQRDQQDTSLEVRLASPGDQAVRWIAGAYFGDIERRVVVSQGSDLNRGFTPAAFVPSNGLNPTDLLYDDTFNSMVVAGFGQLAVDVAEGVEVALAVRYDREKREVDNNVPTCTGSNASGPCRAQTPGFAFGSNPFINPAYTANPAFATAGIPNRDKTYSQFQPKLTVNWKITEDFSTFASYGYGFRSGGFNSSGSLATIEQNYAILCTGPTVGAPFAPGGQPLCDANGSDRNLIAGTVRDDYDKEVSKAAELGFKATLAGGSLQVNGAVFHTTVEDMLFFNFFAGPFGLLRAVTNIDEVTIQGAELDARWRATDMITLFAGAALVDGEIDEHRSRPYTVGNEVPYAPKYTGNAGIDFNVPLGTGGLALTARLDASFVGPTWFHSVQEETVPNLFSTFGFGQGNLTKLERDAFTVLNARVGLQGEKWSVTAWGRNVADEEYRAEIIPAPEFGGAFIHDAHGRSYGVDLTYKF